MACNLQPHSKLYFKLYLCDASQSASLQLSSTQICEVCVCALLQTCDPTCVATPVSSRKLLGESSPWATLGVALFDIWQAGSKSKEPRRRKLADRPCCTTSTTQVSSPQQSINQSITFLVFRTHQGSQQTITGKTIYTNNALQSS